MGNKWLHLIPLAGVLWGIGLPAYSQSPVLQIWRVSVEGRASQVNSLSGELFDSQHQLVASALLTDDEFVFRQVPTGQYKLVVNDAAGKTLFEENVLASSEMSPPAVRLAGGETQKPPSGPVSVHELQHTPAPKAVRAVAAAQRSEQEGDYLRAVELLQGALRISPDYPIAHSSLAVQYARLGKYQEAATESQRAMDLGTANPIDLCNLSFAQAQLHRFADATESARRCLVLAPASPKGHYLLGTLLALDRQTIADAVPHLELAAKTLDSARTQLDAVKRAMRRGQTVRLVQ